MTLAPELFLEMQYSQLGSNNMSAVIKQKCRICNKNKSINNFGKASTCKNGRRKQCKSCLSKKSSKRYFKNKERHQYRLFVNRLKIYNLTVEEYNNLCELQNFVCAICKNKNRSGRRLAVDHCHKTGKVRGLLCDGCNIGLGKLGDTIESITLALKYLQGAYH